MASMQKMSKGDEKKHINFLKRLKQIKKTDRNDFFSHCSDADIQVICESCNNVYHNTLNLKDKKREKVKRKLLPIKKEFTQLCQSRTSNKKRRTLLKNTQVGSGVFTILASTVLPILLSSLLKK